VGEARLSIAHPAVQSGRGLFETLALREGCGLELDPHLERLLAGVAVLGIVAPSHRELRDTAVEAAGGDAPALGWLKIVVVDERSFVFRGPIDPAEVGRNVSAVLLPWRRNEKGPLDGLKTLNYAGNVVGLEHARGRDADEGLWLNSRGHLAEGCASNLFVVRGGSLFTPSERDGILPGVVRGLVLAAARRLGLPVHEGRLRLPRLERAAEAFLTSSVRGVRPLVRFEGRPVGRGEPGPLTRRIAAEVERVREEGRKSRCSVPSA
jgi:branched-subunit amino acid aminotransferase/4-amino-4-deoxychorismate lyase